MGAAGSSRWTLRGRPSWLPERAWRLGEVTAEASTLRSPPTTATRTSPREAERRDDRPARRSGRGGRSPRRSRPCPKATRSERSPTVWRTSVTSQELSGSGPSGLAIRRTGTTTSARCSGRADGDWVVIDFEGEPASLPERRREALAAPRPRRHDALVRLRRRRRAPAAGRSRPRGGPMRAARRSSTATLAASDERLLPPSRAGFDRLLALFELEKLAYEPLRGPEPSRTGPRSRSSG